MPRLRLIQGGRQASAANLTLVKNTSYTRGVAIYSCAHFIVDFACAYLMFSRISASPRWYLCVLIYNFCAFAMQAPIGVIADRLNKNSLLAASDNPSTGAWEAPGRNNGMPLTLLAAILVMGLAVGTAVLIKVVWKAK
jgi:hypothetical protein